MNNRQAGRRRGRGGQRQGGNPGRPDNGNRIDNRARGNAAQLLEKYKNLAQDAQRSGDRVSTEYYLQFADHYFRVLAESRSRMEDGSQPRRQQGDDEDAEGVEDFGFEGDLGSPAHYQQPQRQQADRDADDGAREDRPRRDRDDRPRQRDDQPREARPRRDREGNGDAGETQRPRREREASNDIGEERPRREPRSYGRDQGGDSLSDTVNGNAAIDRPTAANDAPARRGRPRRETAAVANEGFDAALLPPAISAEAAPSDDDAGAERPRRGRPRRVRNDDEVVPPAA